MALCIVGVANVDIPNEGSPRGGRRLREVRITPAWTHENRSLPGTPHQIKEMDMTTTTTLSPKIIGRAEKHHTAVLSRSLAGTGVDEQQWITLNQALAAGAPVDRSGHAARVAAMTQWPRAAVDDALAALIGGGLARELPGDQVEITDAGRALAARVRTGSGRIISRAYGAVSPEDLATAARVLTTITARMADELANS
jgi:hypothetical protein